MSAAFLKVMRAAGWAALLPLALPCAEGAERGYLGFQLTSLGDRALVRNVEPAGPGGRSVLEGDVVVEFNGVPFKFNSDLALIRALDWVRPGVPVELTLLRKEKKMKVVVVPARFRAEDLAALEDWLKRADMTEQGQRKACALESFKALAAPPGIEVTFKRGLAGRGHVMTTSRHDLPPDLDLSDAFLERLLSKLKPGDQATLRYRWSGGALRSEIVTAPAYVDQEEVSRKALEDLRAAGATVRKPS